MWTFYHDHSSLHIPRAFSCKQGLGRILCAQHSLSERFEVRTALAHTKRLRTTVEVVQTAALLVRGNLRAASGKLLKHTTPIHPKASGGVAVEVKPVKEAQVQTAPLRWC